MKKQYKYILYILPGILLYSFFCYNLNFTQDDAYISYRFVQNFLDGNGLVFNIGERVEGFTNFGWVLYMIFLGKLSLNYILISKITGYIFGAGVIYLVFLIASQLEEFKNKILIILSSVYITASSQSLAYWAIAGLETSAFAFFALFSLYLYLNKNKLLPFVLITAVMLRPEGALIAILFITIEFITSKKFPTFSFRSAIGAFILGIPYLAFKMYYYGDILPNSFYAKTGMTVTQLSNGLEYFVRFISHYGFYGIPLLIAIFLWKKLSKELKTVFLFTTCYTIYLILVGGDVLKVHRFFIPIIGLYAIVTAYAVSFLTQLIPKNIYKLVSVTLAILLCGLTYYLPNKFVKQYNNLEIHFIDKMSIMADNIQSQDSTNFSVALPTIGVFSYKLMGHHIIDMLGLTDSTIAKHGEPPIEGMQTTWKESKHNSAYILNFAPDYIMFSTGVKPSAPAEKALMLYPRFLQSYGQLGWYVKPDYSDNGTVQMVFKKKDTLSGEIKPTYPLEFVDYYKLGLDSYSSGDQRKAISYYDRAIKVSPKPVYTYLIYQKAFSHFLLRDHENAEKLLNYVVSLDSSVFMAHKDLYLYAMLKQDSQKTKIHENWLKKIVPWYFPRIDSLTHMTYNQAVKNAQTQSGK